jgi:hypothetical protein
MAGRDYVFNGPNERLTLEAGDNGVTNTTDGIHPNAAGILANDAAWAAAMGI